MRCTPCSPGCDHCWHLRMADRMGHNPIFDINERPAYLGGGPVMTYRLDDPLHIRKPSRIGVQFMGDLFHESVDIKLQHRIFEVMAQNQKHAYFLLTKRPQNVERVFKWWAPHYGNLSHVWLGVTICNQAEADEKIPILLKIPAAHRWVSYEPAIEAVDFTKYLPCSESKPNCSGRKTNGLFVCSQNCLEGVNWIVAGAETGPGARPAENAWFRSVRDQCRAAGVPYFQKQCMGPIPDDLQIKEYPDGK
jgi:protein gp37